MRDVKVPIQKVKDMGYQQTPYWQSNLSGFGKDSVPGRTVHTLTPHLMPDPTPVSKSLSPLLTPLTDSINVIEYLSQGRDPYLYPYLSILACSQGGALLLLLKRTAPAPILWGGGGLEAQHFRVIETDGGISVIANKRLSSPCLKRTLVTGLCLSIPL